MPDPEPERQPAKTQFLTPFESVTGTDTTNVLLQTDESSSPAGTIAVQLELLEMDKHAGERATIWKKAVFDGDDPFEFQLEVNLPRGEPANKWRIVLENPRSRNPYPTDRQTRTRLIKQELGAVFGLDRVEFLQGCRDFRRWGDDVIWFPNERFLRKIRSNRDELVTHLGNAVSIELYYEGLRETAPPDEELVDAVARLLRHRDALELSPGVDTYLDEILRGDSGKELIEAVAAWLAQQ